MMDPVAKRLVSALTEAPRSIRDLLDAWETFDEDLRDHYVAQTEWLLMSIREHLDRDDAREFSQQDLSRVERASRELADLGDRIEETMGLRPESILPPELAARRSLARSARRALV